MRLGKREFVDNDCVLIVNNTKFDIGEKVRIVNTNWPTLNNKVFSVKSIERQIKFEEFICQVNNKEREVNTKFTCQVIYYLTDLFGFFFSEENLEKVNKL